MEISLTVEQESQLSHIAALAGKGPDELAREVLLRGLKVEEAALLATRSGSAEGQEAAARMFELRKGNLLPDGVTLQDLMREGRD